MKNFKEVTLNEKILKKLGYEDKNKIEVLHVPETYEFEEEIIKITKIGKKIFKNLSSSNGKSE